MISSQKAEDGMIKTDKWSLESNLNYKNSLAFGFALWHTFYCPYQIYFIHFY